MRIFTAIGYSARMRKGWAAVVFGVVLLLAADAAAELMQTRDGTIVSVREENVQRAIAAGYRRVTLDEAMDSRRVLGPRSQANIIVIGGVVLGAVVVLSVLIGRTARNR
jgi:hypothetical protein